MPDNGVILVFIDEPTAQLELESAIARKAKTKNVKLFFVLLPSKNVFFIIPPVNKLPGSVSEKAYERLSEGRIFRSSGGALAFDSNAFFDSVIRHVNVITVSHMIGRLYSSDPFIDHP